MKNTCRPSRAAICLGVSPGGEWYRVDWMTAEAEQLTALPLRPALSGFAVSPNDGRLYALDTVADELTISDLDGGNLTSIALTGVDALEGDLDFDARPKIMPITLSPL